MKWLWVNRILLTALSVTTGAVKLARMPEEMKLFLSVGFSEGAIVAFGVVQLVAGILLLPSNTTHVGAWLMVPTFVAATGVLFLAGMIPFGLFSILFVAMAVVHALKWPRKISD